MQLYLISYEHFFEGETELVSSFLAEYELTFHLRKPNASFKEYNGFLDKVPEDLHHKIMLHGAYDLISEYNVKGIHFSTKNRHLQSEFTDCYCGTSSHSLDEVRQQEKQFDYQFISPVFPSISKLGYKGSLDLIEIENYLQTPRANNLVALGGITENNIAKLKQTGFDGAAVLGKVWGNTPQTDKNIKSRLDKIYQCFDK